MVSRAPVACLGPELEPFRMIHMQPVGQLGHCFDALRSDDRNSEAAVLGTGLDIVR